jgi:hypothetical protein
MSKPSLDESDPSNESDTDYWTLLDLNFGIPLFDRSLNREICHLLVTRRLFSSVNLKELEEANGSLCLSLNEFIGQFEKPVSGYSSSTSDPLTQSAADIDPILHYTYPPSKSRQEDFPSCNLIFANGLLEQLPTIICS